MGWKEISKSKIKQALILDLEKKIIEKIISNTNFLINSEQPAIIASVSNELLQTFNQLKKKGIQPLFIGTKALDIDGIKTRIGLNMARKASKEETLKAVINSKAEQLFIYGRDVWEESIIKIEGKKENNKITFIHNENNEFLGIAFMKKELKGLALRNIIDIGYYLRCEKN